MAYAPLPAAEALSFEKKNQNPAVYKRSLFFFPSMCIKLVYIYIYIVIACSRGSFSLLLFVPFIVWWFNGFIYILVSLLGFSLLSLLGVLLLLVHQVTFSYDELIFPFSYFITLAFIFYFIGLTLISLEHFLHQILEMNKQR